MPAFDVRAEGTSPQSGDDGSAQCEIVSQLPSRPHGISAWLAVVTLSTGAATFSLSSCSAPPMERFLSTNSISILDRPEKVREACGHLEIVERQLERLEELRGQASIVFWPLLELNSDLKQRYNEAVECHRGLCKTACAYKEQLLGESSCSEEEVQAIRDWAVKTEADLASIFELIEYVQSHGGKWKSAWVAPQGYEFIQPISLKE